MTLSSFKLLRKRVYSSYVISKLFAGFFLIYKIRPSLYIIGSKHVFYVLVKLDHKNLSRDLVYKKLFIIFSTLFFNLILPQNVQSKNTVESYINELCDIFLCVILTVCLIQQTFEMLNRIEYYRFEVKQIIASGIYNWFLFHKRMQSNSQFWRGWQVLKRKTLTILNYCITLIGNMAGFSYQSRSKKREIHNNLFNIRLLQLQVSV
jgi:hypothetical protein